MATTLVQFWTAARDTQKLAQSGAQADFTAAQAALADARTALDKDTKALDKVKDAIAADRKALADASVPSQVTALNAGLRDKIIEQRGLQGRILDDQDALADAQAGAAGAAAALARATARVTEADARLAAATDGATARQKLIDQLALPPFSTLKADATAFAGGAVATDAKAEIDVTFPAPLQTIAAQRRKTRSDRVATIRQGLEDAEDALGNTQATADGLTGEAAQKGIEFRRADEALRGFVTTAQLRYDRAVAVLTNLQALKKGIAKPDLLSPQEKADIAATPGRTTAETNALPLDTKRAAIYTAEDALDVAVLTQIDTDVDALRTDAGLKAKRAAPGTAAAALKAAETAFEATADDKTLHEWEAVVRDPLWATLIDYLEARDTLDYLKATTPADFSTALATAEDAYAVALAAAAKAQRAEDALADEIARRAARVEAASTQLPSRLLSAVRGDSH